MVEGLICLIHHAKNNGSFWGIHIGGLTNVTNFLFVDDILIFCYGSRREVAMIQCILDLFVEATSIVYNKRKSMLSFMNLDQEVVDWIRT